jgi:hypothetical protein
MIRSDLKNFSLLLSPFQELHLFSSFFICNYILWMLQIKWLWELQSRKLHVEKTNKWTTTTKNHNEKVIGKQFRGDLLTFHLLRRRSVSKTVNGFRLQHNGLKLVTGRLPWWPMVIKHCRDFPKGCYRTEKNRVSLNIV